VTAPGVRGSLPAFIGEQTISFVLMSTILVASNRETLARYTPYLVGFLYATSMILEAPLSGMSMNPARSFAPALHARNWHAMLALFHGANSRHAGCGGGVSAEPRWGSTFCAKLHHANNKRCIFRHRIVPRSAKPV